MAIVYNPMDAITPALSSIAGGVAQMINPFHNLQIAVRNKIAEDPTLAQNLSDLNDASPGLLDTLGLGQVGKAIAKIPPTPAQIIRRNTQAALEKASSNETNANINATKAVTGMTPAAVQTETAASGALQNPAVAATAGLKAATGMTPDEFATSQLTTKNIGQAQAYIMAHPQEGVNKLVDSVISGSLPLSEAAPLFNSPLGKVMGDMFNLRMHQMDIAAMGQWRLSGKADQYDDAMDRLRTTRAAIAWHDIGFAGNPETLKQLMFDPATQQHVTELMADPTKVKTVQDQQLVEAERGLMNAGQANRTKQLGAAAATLRVMTDGFQKSIKAGMPEDSQTTALLSIQDQLNIRAANGAEQLTVHYGKLPKEALKGFHPLGGDEQLYFTNSHNQVVSPDLATNSTGVSSDITNKVNSTFSIYQRANPAQRQRLLEGIDPEVKRLLMQRIAPVYSAPAPSADTGDQ